MAGGFGRSPVGSGSASRTGARVVAGVTAVALAVAAAVGLLVAPNALDPSARDDRLLVAIDDRTFPDAAWRGYVAATFDADGDGCLSEEEARAVTHIGAYDIDSLEVVDEGASGKGIVSFAGIERFPNLEMLVAQDNDVEHFDVTGNPKLLRIDLRGNGRFDISYTDEQAALQVLVDEGARVVSNGASA